METTVSLENYLTEEEFVAEALKRGLRLTRRTVRKWRHRRMLPFIKLNNTILIPKNWDEQVKLTKPRHATTG